jgi:hypothetical protein
MVFFCSVSFLALFISVSPVSGWCWYSVAG